MKTIYWIGLIAAIGLIGCRKRSDISVKTDDGSIDIHTDESGGGRATFNSKDGKISYSQDQQGNGTISSIDSTGHETDYTLKSGADSEELGVPAYPNATPMPGSKGTLTVQTADGTRSSVTLVSPDGIEQIAEFYRLQIAGSSVLRNAGGAIVSGKNARGEPIVVIINPVRGENRIWIAVTRR